MFAMPKRNATAVPERLCGECRTCGRSILSRFPSQTVLECESCDGDARWKRRRAAARSHQRQLAWERLLSRR